MDPELWQEAINCFNNLEREETPNEKFKVVCQTIQIVSQTFIFSSEKQEGIDADSLLKILIYVISKSEQANKRLYLNLQFMRLFQLKDIGFKEEGYNYTTFQGVLMFILN